MSARLKIAIVTPLTPELCDLLTTIEPRIDLRVNHALLPPMRWIGDHEGDPAFGRSSGQQRAFEQLTDSAQALYGIPDSSPSQLARTVRGNSDLRWVHTMAAGGGGQIKAAGLTAGELTRIDWSTSAGPHAGPLAEFAVFGVLAGAKTLPRLQRQQAERAWSDRWVMRHLHEMTILVLGLGSIGRGIADRFAALGARVIAMNSSPREHASVDRVYPPDRLLEAAAQADAIVSSLPGTDTTHHLLGAQVLNAARAGVIVVNVGRGTVVDEQALLEALATGQVGYAALDVFETEPLPAASPLWGKENVLIAPHTAALSDDEDRLIAELFAENASRLLDGRDLLNRVNLEQFY